MQPEPPKILCALQSDDLAPSVVATARRMADAGGYELRFLHAADVPRRTVPVYAGVTGTPAYSRDAMAREFTADGEEMLARLGVDPKSAEIVLGDPAQELTGRAEEISPDFIILGSRGHGPLAGAILGSVTRALAEDGRWPLLIVSKPNEAASPGAVVCGITFPLEDAVLVARTAEQLAHRLGTPLALAHVAASERSQAPFVADGVLAASGAVLPTATSEEATGPEVARFLDAVASRLGTGIKIRKEVLSGAPAAALEALADEVEAEAIVVGRRGLGAVRSAILGSVSFDLIRGALRPTMVVPGTGER